MGDVIVRADGAAPHLTIAAMVEMYRTLERQAPQPIDWYVTLPYRVWKEERRVLRVMMLRGPLRVWRKQ